MQCSGSQRGQWDQLGMIVYMWERWSDGEGGASEMGSGYELQWDAVALAPVCIQQSRHVGTHTHIHTLIWRNKCTLEMEQKSVGGFGSCCRWLCGLFEWEVGGVEREWQRERERGNFAVGFSLLHANKSVIMQHAFRLTFALCARILFRLFRGSFYSPYLPISPTPFPPARLPFEAILCAYFWSDIGYSIWPPQTKCKLRDEHSFPGLERSSMSPRRLRAVLWFPRN